ncbi:hypothetical protein ACIRJR_34770 [Streptomyces sp. NPDC102402]|uniref:hypothetical protein n=1 Tax=Streptomyces sp. NPDC102402 TaxID=3366169 RepID=UPI0037FC8EE7
MTSRIPGIGRQRIERGFMREVMDLMVRVADASFIAVLQRLRAADGIESGPAAGAGFRTRRLDPAPYEIDVGRFARTGTWQAGNGPSEGANAAAP